MAREFASISRNIPWSLLLKGGLFGGSWLFFPFWLFLLAGLGLYVLPFFRPRALEGPFILLLFLARFLPQTFLAAAFLGSIFFLILGIKDFVFVNRRIVYEVVVFLITFPLLVLFFARWSEFGQGSALGALGLSLALAYLSAGFLRGEEGSAREGYERRFLLGLEALVLWQFTLAVLFLPLRPLAETGMVFLAFALILNVFSEHVRHEFGRFQILLAFSIFFVLATFVLVSTQWTL